MLAAVVSVCTSDVKGAKKKAVGRGRLLPDWGIEGDAHGGNWHRQISLLGIESINKIRNKGLHVNSGDFAENITTEGIELYSLPIGTQLKIGDTLLEITQIGKECHSRCTIFQTVGDCVMPREGVFARVLRGGIITKGDRIEIMEHNDEKFNGSDNSTPL